jgi:hypothetical protein
MWNNSLINKSGVYKIESSEDPKFLYIGSSINFRIRKNKHLNDLKNSKHSNYKLQNHYNKYGKESLIFSILAVCDKNDLIPINGVIWIEQCFLWGYKPTVNILSIAGSHLGAKRSNESRERIKKRKLPSDFGHKMSVIAKNRPPMSEEQKNKLKIAATGNKHTPEYKEKMSKLMTGRVVSEETRKKLSDINKGHYPSDETRKKLSEWQLGRKRPPRTKEHTQKLLESRIRNKHLKTKDNGADGIK